MSSVAVGIVAVVMAVTLAIREASKLQLATLRDV